MSSETRMPSAEDLDRLRLIAEQGRDRPLLGGRHLVLWGTIVAIASALHWSLISGRLNWEPWALAFIWFGLAAAGSLVSTVIGRREDRKPAARSIGNMVEHTVWTTGGAVLATVAIGIFVFASFAGDPAAFAYFNAMPPITFGIFAMALNASAVAGRARRLVPFAVLSIAFAAAAALTIGEPVQYLVMAAGAVMVSIVPGFVQIGAEQRSSRSDG